MARPYLSLIVNEPGAWTEATRQRAIVALEAWAKEAASWPIGAACSDFHRRLDWFTVADLS